MIVVTLGFGCSVCCGCWVCMVVVKLCGITDYFGLFGVVVLFAGVFAVVWALLLLVFSCRVVALGLVNSVG